MLLILVTLAFLLGTSSALAFDTSAPPGIALSPFVNAGPFGYTFPIAQAFRDDLGGLHGRPTQARVFDDLALHALALLMQPFAQCLKLADEPVDFLDRTRRYALKQRADIVRHDLAVILRVLSQAGDVAAHKFSDFPFHSFHLLQSGDLMLEDAHV
jgi:hypothetical protein